MPNGVMATQTVVNMTTLDPRVMAVIPFGIGYSSDIDKARKILVQLASDHPKVERTESCPVTKLGDSAVVLSLRAWCMDADAAKQLEFDLYEQATKRFAQEGMEIPFPTRNVVIQNEGHPSPRGSGELGTVGSGAGRKAI